MTYNVFGGTLNPALLLANEVKKYQINVFSPWVQSPDPKFEVSVPLGVNRPNSLGYF